MSQGNVFIETYGCQMNVLDSELVRGQLAQRGFQMVEHADEANVVLLNTCSVRELSEQKVWSRLGRLGISKREGEKDLVIGVLGCMAEREAPEIARRMPHVDIICGPSKLDALPSLLENIQLNKGRQVELSGHVSRRTATLDAANDGVHALDLSRAFSPTDSNPFQAYVRITRGCNKFCSFCVVPFTRGPEVHRPPEHIVLEVQKLVDAGVIEVTLVGQTINHYSYEDGGRTTSFADLLMLIHENVPGVKRLRFVTSYPRDFGDDALDAMAACDRICKYLHIPAQSGSNTMLRKMNRGYTVEGYMELLERARSRMPSISLAGDMIVGFPGETDADHEASIKLLRDARYKSCFIFKYSPRSGTVANRRLEDDVPDATKKARNIELLGVQHEVSTAHNEAKVGSTVRVLVESRSKLKKPPSTDLVSLGSKQADAETGAALIGRTEGDEIVALRADPSLIGSMVDVQVVRATALTLFGEIPSVARVATKSERLSRERASGGRSDDQQTA